MNEGRLGSWSEATTLRRFLSRVFSWHTSQISDELDQRLEAAHIYDLYHAGDGAHQCTTPAGLIRVHRLGEVPFWQQRLDMPGQLVEQFLRIALRLQHILKGDVMCEMTIKSLAWQPSTIPHRPGFGPMIDPLMVKHKR